LAIEGFVGVIMIEIPWTSLTITVVEPVTVVGWSVPGTPATVAEIIAFPGA
jgi:hypothetical protein